MYLRTCIVTGATSGIGKAMAYELAQRGAKVVLICRNGERAARISHEIKTATRNDHVDPLVADLSSQKQIRAVAAEFNRKYHRLDVLVNNAGATFPRRKESVDGIEMTLAVNHLAPFLLTNLLLGNLLATRGARVINVNSDAHEHGKIDFDNLQMQRRYGRGVGMRAYSNAKLANLLTVYALARRIRDSGVTVNAFHPGYVATNIVSLKTATGPLRLLQPFWGTAMRFILTPEQGAATGIYLACSTGVSGVSGKYFYRGAPIRSVRRSYDTELQSQVWDVSERLTGLRPGNE